MHSLNGGYYVAMVLAGRLITMVEVVAGCRRLREYLFLRRKGIIEFVGIVESGYKKVRNTPNHVKCTHVHPLCT